jgi:hypothetical protein
MRKESFLLVLRWIRDSHKSTTTFRHVPPCRPTQIYKRFGRTYCSHLHSRKINQINIKLFRFKHHVINKYGVRRYSFTILVLGNRWKWVVSFMSCPLYPWCLLNTRGWVGPRPGIDDVKNRIIEHKKARRRLDLHFDSEDENNTSTET